MPGRLGREGRESRGRRADRRLAGQRKDCGHSQSEQEPGESPENVAAGPVRLVQGRLQILTGWLSGAVQARVSVRVGIIDSDFVGRNKIECRNAVGNDLSTLPEDIQSDLSTLLLLDPEETKTSFTNVELDDPISSKL
jgi:hypothetical protein